MGETLQPEPLLSVKSKFDAEFRRFSISTTKLNYEDFEKKVCNFRSFLKHNENSRFDQFIS